MVVRERFPGPERERAGGAAVAGHTLTLLPALRLENLLPLELTFRAAAADDAAPRAAGALPPAETHPFHEVPVFYYYLLIQIFSPLTIRTLEIN